MDFLSKFLVKGSPSCLHVLCVFVQQCFAKMTLQVAHTVAVEFQRPFNVQISYRDVIAVAVQFVFLDIFNDVAIVLSKYCCQTTGKQDDNGKKSL